MCLPLCLIPLANGAMDSDPKGGMSGSSEHVQMQKECVKNQVHLMSQSGL